MNNLQSMTVQDALQEGYTFLSPAQKEAQKNYIQMVNSRDGRSFIMQKVDNYEAVSSQLTLGQKGVLLVLATTLKMDKQGKLFVNEKERLTVADASRLIGKKPNKTSEVINELENYGLITKEKEGKKVYLNINEGFYKCGKLEEKIPVVKIYKVKLREVAKELTLNEMGILSDLLTHMHWGTHLLCSNPTVMNNSELELWRAKDVVELLGISKPTVLKALKKFRELRIIVEIRTVRDVILLHPNLVSRQSQKMTLDRILEVIEEAHLSSDNYRK